MMEIDFLSYVMMEVITNFRFQRSKKMTTIFLQVEKFNKV